MCALLACSCSCGHRWRPYLLYLIKIQHLDLASLQFPGTRKAMKHTVILTFGANGARLALHNASNLSAQIHTSTHGNFAHWFSSANFLLYTGTVVGRTKILCFGGVKGELASSDISILKTDTMKWLVPQVKWNRVCCSALRGSCLFVRRAWWVFQCRADTMKWLMPQID